MKIEGAAPSANFVAAWRWWGAPAALALALVIIFMDPFIGEWDALEYTTLSVQGRPSSLILGRLLFIFVNHALWLVAHTLFGLSPEKAYLLFKYAVVAQSPLAVIAWWVLARDLTGSVRAATVAALLLALSPYFIIYGGQVMTEIPSLLLLAVALIMHLRGLRQRRVGLVLLGAALLGLGVNVREAALLYAPWLVVAPLACGWRWGRREVLVSALAILLFLTLAFGGFAFWWLMDIGGYRREWHEWVGATRLETARHPATLSNFLPLLLYFFIASPLTLTAFPAAAFKEWKHSGFSPLLSLAVVGLLANLALVSHYSVAINWRYLLTGLPALTPLVAAHFMRRQTVKLQSERRAFISAVLGVGLIAALSGIYLWPTNDEYVQLRASTQDYRERLTLLPRDAVVMAGGQTVGVKYWRGLGAGDWETIGTGAGWPGARLHSVIENYLKEDRRVFLDADPRWWAASGWQAEETFALASLESRFRFRRVSATIYEIRPPDDMTAQDAPPLKY